MKKKMVFLDLDKTTLRDDKTPSPETLSAIARAAEMGHYVAISTGRAFSSAIKVAELLDMYRENCFLIAFNGAMIYDLHRQEFLRKLMMPDDLVAYLLQEAQAAGFYAQTYGEELIFAPRDCPELRYYLGESAMSFALVPDLAKQKVFSTPKVEIVAINNRKGLQDFQQKHLAWERGKCVSFFSAPQYLEYCPLLATKADGIDFFEEYLGLAHENTIAVGDEENDLSMIRRAGIGIAMQNAVDSVKAEADYVTEKDNNASGVAEAFERFVF